MGISMNRPTKAGMAEKWFRENASRLSGLDLERFKNLLEERYAIKFKKDGKAWKQAVAHGAITIRFLPDGSVGGQLNGTADTVGATRLVMDLDRQILGRETTGAEAMKMLSGHAPATVADATAARAAVVTSNQEARPLMPRPPSEQQKEQLYAYLRDRGISRSVALEAQAEGALQLTSKGVSFVGLDHSSGEVRMVETRFVAPVMIEGEMRTKHTEAGTSRVFPPIMHGSAEDVHIVEGGIDMLALREKLEREGQGRPTIIMSGGASSGRKILENEHVQAIVRDAKTITIWAENEATEDVQQKTDAQHQRNAAGVVVLRGTADGMTIQRPPAGFKDVAVWNQALKAELRMQRAAVVTPAVGMGGR